MFMTTSSHNLPKVLTIAGSDSGGGAGIQADLKTFAALGVYGMSAITAITAQNTLGVASVAEVPIEVVSDQIDAVVTDIGADAVKTGMLSSTQIVECVADAVTRYGLSPVVVDPVMVAASGAKLLQDDAVLAVRERMMPIASVVTPNIPEAEELTGLEIDSVDDMVEAANALLTLGSDAVVVKGGHLDDGSGKLVDVLVESDGIAHQFPINRIDTTSNHGTGCTFASAVASYLAHGVSISESVQLSQRYVWNSMATAQPIGNGNGPLNHMHAHTHEVITP